MIDAELPPCPAGLTRFRREVGKGTLVLAVAADAEARAITGALGRPPVLEEWRGVPIADGLSLVRTGVGKANAAGAVAALCAAERPAGILSVGIAGTLPGSPARIGDVVLATGHAFDEGVRTPAGVEPLGGFPPWSGPGNAVPAHAASAALRDLGEMWEGAVATVSICSGTDELAREVVVRTGAIAEAMEGAAVAASASRFGVPWAELRVISNTTGERTTQTWRLMEALGRLGALFVDR